MYFIFTRHVYVIEYRQRSVSDRIQFQLNDSEIHRRIGNKLVGEIH